jgi:hypothetical protein
LDILHSAISLLAPTINSLSQDLIRGTFSAGASRLNNLLVSYEKGFTEYSARLYERCSMVKTLLHRYQPINIDDIYIDANLVLGSKRISEVVFVRDIDKDFSKSIISGTAGSGKSLLLKHVAVRMCKEPKGQLPIFIELRHLNGLDNVGLIDFITAQVSSIVPEFTQKQFLFGLEQGKFALLFDAIDEIEHKKREFYSQQIIDLSTKYQKLPIIVSSRPDDRFIAWHQFNTFTISEFSEAQVLAFVDKIPYDTTIKASFKQIVPRIYETHESFLSNPLLCTMMLMTFDEFADVPQKMHIFYDQALDVLFKKHDASKSLVRKLYSDLGVEDFRTVFETFCLVSYLGSEFSMTERAIKHHIKEALEFEEHKGSSELFLRDLQDSFCVILREGLNYSFLHRSIQEYCTASFLMYRQGPGIYDITDKLINSGWSGHIVDLLYDISRDIFEEKYFARKIHEVMSILDKMDIENHPVGFVRMLYLAISIDHEDHVGFTINDGDRSAEWYPVIEIIERHYAAIWKDVDKSWPSNKTNWVTQLLGPRRSEISSEDLTNEMLKGTPMVKYLLAIRKALTEVGKTVQARIKGRSRRVASILKAH